QRFMSQGVSMAQTGNGWQNGSCTGCDDRSLEPQPDAVHVDAAGVEESALSKKDIHAELPKAPSRVMRADLCPQASHALHDGGKVDLDRCGHPHAKLVGRANRRDGASRAENCLRGNTTDVQAISPEQASLDECYL